MKILQINAYYGTGSTGNLVRDIGEEIRTKGSDVYFVYWLKRNKSIEDSNTFYLGEENEPNMVSKMAGWLLCGGKLRYNNERTKRIIKKIIEIDPDIIHLHNLHGDFEYGSLDYPYFFEALAEMKKRIIWTFHDCWPFTGRCYYFSYKGCSKWQTGCGGCPQKYYDREGILRDFSRVNLAKKKEMYECIPDLKIVTVSKWLEKEVRLSILKNREILTIHNGIRTEIFTPRKHKNEDSKFTILCIGWDRRKGYKDYYRLSKLLGKDEQIVVVGEKPWFRDMRRLPKNIITVPAATSSEKMADIYCSADVYFNSSTAETFGLTTIEAMSCGVPVVGYDATATPELIGADGETGYAVAKNDIESIYHAIQQVKYRNRTYYIEKCRNKVQNNFTRQQMLEKYMCLYRID